MYKNSLRELSSRISNPPSPAPLPLPYLLNSGRLSIRKIFLLDEFLSLDIRNIHPRAERNYRGNRRFSPIRPKEERARNFPPLPSPPNCALPPARPSATEIRFQTNLTVYKWQAVLGFWKRRKEKGGGAGTKRSCRNFARWESITLITEVGALSRKRRPQPRQETGLFPQKFSARVSRGQKPSPGPRKQDRGRGRDIESPLPSLLFTLFHLSSYRYEKRQGEKERKRG